MSLPIGELSLVLIRLRLGLLEQDLAHQFSTLPLLLYLVTWIKFLDLQLRPLITWSSTALIDTHMPAL